MMKQYRTPKSPDIRRLPGNGRRNLLALPEGKFSAALRQERRRTERSRRPFVLMLADLGAVYGGQQTALLEDIASALAASSRETDIIGWHRQNEVLGAIFTEIGMVEKDVILTTVKKKVSAVLEEKLAFKDAKKVNLTFCFFPESSPPDGDSPPRLHTEVYGEKDSRSAALPVKRLIDITGSTMALVLLSPLLVTISLIIKLTSSGPVFFRQTRVGQHGKEFIFLKFRSMYTGNDVSVHKEYVRRFIAGKAQKKESADGKTSAYKVIDDPRVTPFGRFLRKTSLDELPQLLNVLKGEMSLVGPRPPIPYELAAYDVWHLCRIVEAKPGITGLWQVTGRSRTSFDEMVRLDLRYARSWSLALDFKILLRTPGAVLSGDGAY